MFTSWAWLLRRIGDGDPLPCPTCHNDLAMLSAIAQPQLLDEILRHLHEGGGETTFRRSTIRVGPAMTGQSTIAANARAYHDMQNSRVRIHPLPTLCLAVLLILPAVLQIGCGRGAPDPEPGRLIEREGLRAINGTELYVKVIGDGTPITILHGGPGWDHSILLPHCGHFPFTECPESLLAAVRNHLR